jgi:precorrin-6Y C5,15-methyltransferase (decarboxylating)
VSAGEVQVVGIGAEGWSGLAPRAAEVLQESRTVLGSRRQLDLLPASVTARRIPWPSPMIPALPGLLAEHAPAGLAVLASGDPMLFGVGARIVDELGPARVRVVPHPSAVSLACARMGWPRQHTEVVSVVGRPVELIAPLVNPGRRFIVLSGGGHVPGAVAALLRERGYGASGLAVLARLGAPDEARIEASADDWSGEVDPLNVIAVTCRAGAGVAPLPRTPGLPDEAYRHDGQLTKREVRAATLAALRPVAGQLLWDIGAGAGSVGIEWMRSEATCRAVAVEANADRAGLIEANAAALGVPGLELVRGEAPGALAGLPHPDAVFVGGGVTEPGMLPACWEALAEGGRLVVNAVTLEAERAVCDARAELGGELARIAVDRAGPLGRFTTWRPGMPVTQWSVAKP